MTAKLMDEYVHEACTTLTFATANRARAARLTPEELEAQLAKTPSRKVRRSSARSSPWASMRRW